MFATIKSRYPFDPTFKSHLLVALGLTVWIFVFLYATEPLDVSELTSSEKWLYLPLYGLFCSLCYLIIFPIQQWVHKKTNQIWYLRSEVFLLLILIALTFLASRMVYFYIVMDQHPNAYTLDYYFVSIFLPASLTIFPVVVVVRWLFGRFYEKRLASDKIEIKGQGNYESIRLKLEDLIFVQSADNYVEVVYQEGSLKKQLIRTKLNDVERDLPELVRTHRSYLINPFHFKQWKTGNRKLHLILSHDLEVPVSKTYQPTLESAVNSTTKP